MKGNISEKLKAILINPIARRELEKRLQEGREGEIRVNNKPFKLRIAKAN